MKNPSYKYSQKFYGKTLILALCSLIILSTVIFSIFASVIYKNNLKYTRSNIVSENMRGNEQAKGIFDNCMQICMLFATYKNISPVYLSKTDSDLKKATLLKEIATFESCFEYISGIEVITSEFTVQSGSYRINSPTVSTRYKGFEIIYSENEEWPYTMQIKYSANQDVLNTVSIAINVPYISRQCCKDSSYCLSSDGTVIFSNDVTLLGKNISDVTGEDFENLLYNGNKSKYITSATNLLNGDLQFVTLVKASEAQKTFWQQILLLSLALVIITAAGCLLIYSILRKIYSPIEKVVQVFKYYLPEKQDIAESEVLFISQCLYDKNMDEPTKKAALQIRKSQLYVLHSQISPHFLGNALDVLKFESIKELGIGNSIEKALGIISMFLKEAQQYPHMFSRIDEEIERTKEYIKVVTLCFNEYLNVLWDIEDGLLNCVIISLTLQPLIENSVMHGFDLHTQGAVIKVKMRSQDNNICVTVGDNGQGMPPDVLASIMSTISDDSPADRHIGLKNTHLKMRLLYGNEYGIKSITSNEKGTTIELLFPKKFF